MKEPNKIYACFIVLALLFWNPLSFYLFYGNDLVYQSWIMHVVYWVILVTGILIIYLLTKNKINTKVKNLVLSLSVFGIFTAIIIVVNTCMGLFGSSSNTTETVQQSGKKKGLIYEPNSSTSYKTVEFSYTASINSLGLRDKEIQIDKGTKYRILCVGDSWTFGWGVAIEDSWPKKLEQYLHKLGYKNIEVINAGESAKYTTIYKDNVARAVPLLKPDLVLVGVLQLDDLAQLYESNFTVESPPQPTSKERILGLASEFIEASFGNIQSYVRMKRISNEKVKSNWELSAKKLTDRFDRLGKLRFHTLADTVQKLFISGNLNPGQLDYYINFPERTTIFNNPNDDATKYSIAEMNKDFKEMKTVCDQNNAKLVFVNMPSNYFTGHKVIRTACDVLNTFYENNNHIDSIYHSVALTNKLPYIELTELFKSFPEKDKYFYIFDGHPNKKGYGEIADYIADQLMKNNLIKSN